MKVIAAMNGLVSSDVASLYALRYAALFGHSFCRKRSQGTTSCGDRHGSRTKVRIAVPLAATCGTLWPLVPWLFDFRSNPP